LNARLPLFVVSTFVDMKCLEERLKDFVVVLSGVKQNLWPQELWKTGCD
jgi:hypothetical protein